MDRPTRIRRTRYRAWHRGTREADFLVGGYFETYHAEWSEEDFAWFEAILEEQDVDIMAWAIGTATPPEQFAGPMMERLQRTDYIEHPGK